MKLLKLNIILFLKGNMSNLKIEGKEVLKRLNRYFQECQRSYILPTNILLSNNAFKALKNEYPKRWVNNNYLQGNRSIPVLILEEGQIDVGVSLSFTDFKNE